MKFKTSIFTLLLTFIVIVSLSYSFITNIEKNEPINLSTEDKIEEVRYFFDFIRNSYPFDEAVVKYKDLESIYDVEKEYIKRAGETKTNKEYIDLIAEIVQRLEQGSGHNDIAEAQELPPGTDTIMLCFENNLSIDAIRLNKYWWDLLNINKKYSNSDIKVYYKQGDYVVINDAVIGENTINKGAKITKIDGLPIDDYLKKLQKAIWLRFDSESQKAYSFHPSPFITYGDNSKKDWTVEFQETNNKSLTCVVTKKNGFKPIRQYPMYESNILCLELSPTIAYLRVFSFPDVAQSKADLKELATFFEKSNGKYKKLIIDIRMNSGGSPTYGEALLVPFLMTSMVYNQYAAVKKGIHDKIVSETARIDSIKTQDNPNINFGRIEKIAFNELPTNIKKCNKEDKSFCYFRTTKDFTPENTFNFKGEIVLLIDNNSFSASEDIIRIYKELKIGKIAGTNSCGGAAVVYAPSYFELPKSHILFELEFDMAYNSDGTINEIFGTKPDIELETSTYPTSFPDDYSMDGLLNDNWINKIMNDLR
jgi:C-terminal processing protease CtpA/Prc